MVYQRIVERRTIRKYTSKAVPGQVLSDCVNAARLSPSGMNRQPLKYVIVSDEELLKKTFGTLRWAGYLPDYAPSEEEMPRAYIVLLLDKSISESPGHDAGIAAMSISMVATDAGLGTCILAAIDRKRLRRILKVPQQLDIVLAVALGYAAESPVLDEVRDEDVRYWLDEDETLHVPKRDLRDILYWNECKSP